MPLPAQLLVNSGVAFALAFIVATFCHEMAHAIAGILVGTKVTLHHIFVHHPELQPRDAAFVAGCGPVFSLAFGLLGLRLIPRFASQSWMVRCIWIWLTLINLESFAGYLVATPFAPGGDTGAVASNLGWPVWATVLMCALGALGIRLVGLASRGPLLSLAPRNVQLRSADDNVAFIKKFGWLSWALAMLVVIPVHLPPPYWLSLVWPVMSGGFLFPATRRAAGVPVPDDHARPENPSRVGWEWILVLAIVGLLFRGPLACGIQLN